MPKRCFGDTKISSKTTSSSRTEKYFGGEIACKYEYSRSMLKSTANNGGGAVGLKKHYYTTKTNLFLKICGLVNKSVTG